MQSISENDFECLAKPGVAIDEETAMRAHVRRNERPLPSGRRAGGSHSGRAIDISTSVQWDCSTTAPFLNGTDARLSHRGPEGSEKCGAGGREELLLKFDVAVVVEIGCCRRLDWREHTTQACHSGRLWVTNTLTDILFRKHVEGALVRAFPLKPLII